MKSYFEPSLQVICALALAVMMSVGAIDIILGLAFDKYLPFKVELSGLLFAIIIFVSQPLVTMRNEHVVVDIISGKLTSGWKLLSLAIAKLTAIGVLTLLAIAAWSLFQASWNIKERSSDFLQIPIYPVKFMIFAGFTLAALVSVIQLVRLFMKSETGPSDAEEQAEGERTNG